MIVWAPPAGGWVAGSQPNDTFKVAVLGSDGATLTCRDPHQAARPTLSWQRCSVTVPTRRDARWGRAEAIGPDAAAWPAGAASTASPATSASAAVALRWRLTTAS